MRCAIWIVLCWLCCSVAVGQEERIFRPQDGEMVPALAVSPDARMLAVGQGRGVVLFDAVNGALLQTLDWKKNDPVRKMIADVFGPMDIVTGLDYSPDGKLLAACYSDGVICIWRTDSYEKVPSVLRINNRHQACVKFSPDGKTLACGCHDRQVRIFDVATNAVRHVFVGDEIGVECVAFSSNGDFLASSGQDGKIIVWSLRKLKQIAALSGPKGSVMCLAFSPDGNILLSGDQANEIFIWDTKAWRTKGILLAPKSVYGLQYLANSRTAISGDWGGGISVWDIEQQKLLTRTETHDGHSVMSMTMSRDQQFLFCGEMFAFARDSSNLDKTSKIIPATVQSIKISRLLGDESQRRVSRPNDSGQPK